MVSHIKRRTQAKHIRVHRHRGSFLGLKHRRKKETWRKLLRIYVQILLGLLNEGEQDVRARRGVCG